MFRLREYTIEIGINTNAVAVLKRSVLFQLNINKFNLHASWIEMTSGKVSIKYINNWNVLRQESYFLEKKNFARWTIIGKKKQFHFGAKETLFRIEHEGM